MQRACQTLYYFCAALRLRATLRRQLRPATFGGAYISIARSVTCVHARARKVLKFHYLSERLPYRYALRRICVSAHVYPWQSLRAGL